MTVRSNASDAPAEARVIRQFVEELLDQLLSSLPIQARRSLAGRRAVIVRDVMRSHLEWPADITFIARVQDCVDDLFDVLFASGEAWSEGGPVDLLTAMSGALIAAGCWSTSRRPLGTTPHAA